MADPGYRSIDGHPQRRAAWAKHLAEVGPVMCRREGCGRLVYADPAMNWDKMTWQLGHGKAVHHGGTGDDSAPEHAHCNTSGGRAIATTLPPLVS